MSDLLTNPYFLGPTGVSVAVAVQVLPQYLQGNNLSAAQAAAVFAGGLAGYEWARRKTFHKGFDKPEEDAPPPFLEGDH